MNVMLLLKIAHLRDYHYDVCVCLYIMYYVCIFCTIIWIYLLYVYMAYLS